MLFSNSDLKFLKDREEKMSEDKVTYRKQTSLNTSNNKKGFVIS